jgi:ergothioneine biosynthesis protein EgtB
MQRSHASLLRRDEVEKSLKARDFGAPDWIQAFADVRTETERRASLLSPEDQVIQSMPDASPIKWHRAHTTWFFEQFLLEPFAPNYATYDERFAFLFNSYYVAAGPRHARPERGLITRPNVEEVGAYRAHVDAAVKEQLASAKPQVLATIAPILEIGLHHEQQHQELMLTDILHAFSLNPTSPAYDPNWQPPASHARKEWAELPQGVHQIGHSGEEFCFDNELPRHQTFLRSGRISRALVTNGEWLEFIADKGYQTPSLWLSEGWTTVEAQGWEAPGYWRNMGGVWSSLTLGGLKSVNPTAPVCHISYYEADAFARWSGKHLPTEMEWEAAAHAGLLNDAFGLVWQWTRSAYAPYPGYRAAEGALGEYNGKFMVNQMVLRGSSLATPPGHERTTYRNFFHPPARWQFSGLRLVDYD